ncbi:TPA: hypothetical protein ACPYU1_004243 [Raoultella planticola]
MRTRGSPAEAFRQQERRSIGAYGMAIVTARDQGEPTGIEPTAQ